MSISDNAKKSRSIVFFGRSLLSIALILYLITMLDWERIRFILPKLRMEYVWEAFILVILSIFASSARWSALLTRLNVRQGVVESWRYYLISMFYGIMLPGVIGGDVVRLGLSMKKHGANNKAVLTASVLFERACGFMMIIMLAATTALLAPSLLGNDQNIASSVFVLALATLASFALFFALLKGGPARWFNDKRIQNRFLRGIHLMLGQFRNLSIGILFFVLVLSLLINLLDILASFLLAKALHIELAFYLFLLIIPLVYVVTALPISLGGLGVREGVLTFFLIKVGILASDAVLLAFLIYLNRLAVALIGGSVQFMDKRVRPLDRTKELH